MEFQLKKVMKSNLLGVITDNHMNWSSCSKHLQSKLSRTISVPNEAKHVLCHIPDCTLILPY